LVVAPCNVVVGHQHYTGLCLHPGDQGIMDIWNQYPTTTLHSMTTQKTLTWILTSLKTTNLAFSEMARRKRVSANSIISNRVC